MSRNKCFIPLYLMIVLLVLAGCQRDEERYINTLRDEEIFIAFDEIDALYGQMIEGVSDISTEITFDEMIDGDDEAVENDEETINNDEAIKSSDESMRALLDEINFKIDSVISAINKFNNTKENETSVMINSDLKQSIDYYQDGISEVSEIIAYRAISESVDAENKAYYDSIIESRLSNKAKTTAGFDEQINLIIKKYSDYFNMVNKVTYENDLLNQLSEEEIADFVANTEIIISDLEALDTYSEEDRMIKEALVGIYNNTYKLSHLFQAIYKAGTDEEILRNLNSYGEQARALYIKWYNND